ncbi:MAG: tRNA (N(6)-L-threonylcarbamoyladenosine(37)-C(2))-methylthiotransferase MtaB [Candidatus Omnitrophica bacterium]|nr:tRNA (N(6)-L-threonylcarbamoyladenosine(37)-C(2))-methylthiotransferase MtaB [Candidatus Omnitrophota bacterium]
MKTFCIKTLGCKVNQCDADTARRDLLAMGLSEVRDTLKADLRIINTCCVTARASGKSRQAVRRALRHKELHPGQVVVTGCYAGYGRPQLEKVEGIDRIFSRQEDARFLSWLKTMRPHAKPLVPVHQMFAGRARAFLKIQDGCDHRCSYCVVPLMRGPSRSVPQRAVLAQARSLVESGHKEIVLTGVNIGAYGRHTRGTPSLVGLLKGLDRIEGLKRIRLSSIEAHDVTPQLLDTMASSQKFCPHLHIPFQSGDDTVLSSMNRRSRVVDYLHAVDLAVKRMGSLTVTCDIIVGFPTESDACFCNTLTFLRRVRPLKVHIFPFSPRKGTAAAASYQPLAHETVQERVRILKQTADGLSQEVRRERTGSVVDVLFEQKEAGEWVGHSREYLQVFVQEPAMLCKLRNEVRRVRILGLKRDGVYGDILAEVGCE